MIRLCLWPFLVLLACGGGPHRAVHDEKPASPTLSSLATELDASTDDVPRSERRLSAAEWRGRQLYWEKLCAQCHEVHDTGPSLLGIWGQSRTHRARSLREDDVEVVVNRNYLAMSIRRPQYIVRDGFNPVMPSYGKERLSWEQLRDLVAYVTLLAKTQGAFAPQASSSSIRASAYSTNRPGSDLETSRYP